ncbi:uncharacterized protein BT62DRAFT_934905 [Guyanagaster necrorhizus]|uniref:HMG box domain-containing protein n=1 Tax=Guyanagaster necrorhizus TaxID=856835 RepID=A0A9P8AQ37_9AGAR|nr:uncharacterized protein BT62DRAFT_934905 [Guyanagaster necrorhizus MCA 3950]KAG7443674.1 hypothetical protein BT62DRAFT_934905 [Guyanagaster necrorhizus MCA 3950]
MSRHRLSISLGVQSSRRRSAASHSSYGTRSQGQPTQQISFAPNVTPVSYDQPDDDDIVMADEEGSILFPASTEPRTEPKRKTKSKDPNHIPRPANAFMLFRADFVRQKHVPGSIETNHGSLSKIIGSIWHGLPLHEKKKWDTRARQEKARHKKQYPDYQFRPVHNKNKVKGKPKSTKSKKKSAPKSRPTEVDEKRCEDVASLLLGGKKGDELAEAVRQLDQTRITLGLVGRRSSSVPPEVDFAGGPIQLPLLLSSDSLPRRPSSTQPFVYLPYPPPVFEPSYPAPCLPEVNTSLFAHLNPFAATCPPPAPLQNMSVSPFEQVEYISPFDCPPSLASSSVYSSSQGSSQGGSSQASSPGPEELPVFAPQPQMPAFDWMPKEQRMSLANIHDVTMVPQDTRLSISSHFGRPWEEISDEWSRLTLSSGRFSLSDVLFSAEDMSMGAVPDFSEFSN